MNFKPSFFELEFVTRRAISARPYGEDKREGALLAAHYLWLFTCIPLPVAAASVLFGGFMVGAIVTATHQTEEIIFEPDGEFVDVQFRSTREADVGPGVERWLWGGMVGQCRMTVSKPELKARLVSALETKM